MRIQSTAPDRKALVKALAEHLEQDAVYCGPPSFAYTIGGVVVDREGVIILTEDVDTTAIQSFLVSKGWLEPEPAPDRLTISVPVDGLSVQTMHNLILMLYSKQYLLGKALKEDTIRIDDAVIERLHQSAPETPTDFRVLVDEFKAQGQIAGVAFADDAVSLSYPLSDRQDVIHTYTILTVNIIAAAKAATRVLPDRQQPENEKYYMRNWLVRLGFGGKESKGMRTILLKHLKGHSAFRTDAEADKHSFRRTCLTSRQSPTAGTLTSWIPGAMKPSATPVPTRTTRFGCTTASTGGLTFTCPDTGMSWNGSNPRPLSSAAL